MLQQKDLNLSQTYGRRAHRCAVCGLRLHMHTYVFPDISRRLPVI